MNQTIYSFIPLVRTHLTTTNIMFLTILALLPSAGYGMYLYGFHAALLMGICVITAVAGEAILSLILRRGWTILDYSAVVTGLIGGMLLPARAPYYMAVILALVAVISKAAFGGIGRNWINPAGLGKLVLVIAFHSTMVNYTGGEYGTVGALTLIREGEEIALGNMLLGHTAGPIGTGSAVTILIGAAFLLLVGIADIYIPLAYIGTFSVFWVILGGYGLSPYQLAVQLAGGSLLFTAFFMAQDSTTSPMSRQGKVVYGALLGLLTGILRRIGVVENGALIALLVCNLSVRWLDTKTFPAIFGVDATVRRVRRDRRRRQDNPNKEQVAADSVTGFQEFEEHVVPKDAMSGSETAGTINADSIESFHNRRAVTYDTATLDPAAVKRELQRQGHAMRQSMPIFGQTTAQTPQRDPASQESPQTRRRKDVPSAGQTGTIPQAELNQALAAGQTGTIPQAELNQALAAGQTGTIPQAELNQALAAGQTGTIPQAALNQALAAGQTGTIPQAALNQALQQTQAIPQDLYGQQNVPPMNYGIPTYPNGQPMMDLNGNPLPLLDEYGNPVLDEYGNMIWGQPMQMPYSQPYVPQYSAPAMSMPSMPVYGQTEDDHAATGAASHTRPTRDTSSRTSHKAVPDEPVSRDTDILEVAKILEAARAAEQSGGESELKDVQYMDLSSGFSSPEVRKAASRLGHKRTGRRRTNHTEEES